MVAFLRRLLQFVKPYRVRLILGIASGALFGLTNAALMLAVKVVIDLIFSGGASHTLADQIGKLPAFVRSLVESVAGWFPKVESPATTAGVVLVVAAIPVAVLFGVIR